jgi:hypothetical protein
MDSYQRNIYAIRLFVGFLLVIICYGVWAGGKVEAALTNKIETIYIAKGLEQYKNEIGN